MLCFFKKYPNCAKKLFVGIEIFKIYATIISNYEKEDLTMAYKISDDCIACGACAAGCPVEAISEGDGKYVIDEDACIDCGACADTCPVGAPTND